MIDRLYWIWLQFLRFSSVIDLYGAQVSGNLEAIAWQRMRIADLDRQIDHIALCGRSL